MPKLVPISHRELARKLRRAGFVEIRTKNDKITMHADALERKLKFGRKEKMQWHTVAIDTRDHPPSYYYHKGVGSFRLSTMEKVDPEQLRLKLA